VPVNEFDPNQPVEDSPLDAAEMRNQRNGLADRIGNCPTPPPTADAMIAASAGPVTRIGALDLTFPIAHAGARADRRQQGE